MEAQAINERGVYRVGFLSEDDTSSVEMLTLNTVIQLTVPQGEQGYSEGYSKKLTIDDLKDLQSKLMLIAAKASQGKEDVDRFVEVRVFWSAFQPSKIILR